MKNPCKTLRESVDCRNTCDECLHAGIACGETADGDVMEACIVCGCVHCVQYATEILHSMQR